MNRATLPSKASLFAIEAPRVNHINQIIGAQRLKDSALARCIAPLLVAIDWYGAPRSLQSYLPEKHKVIGIEEFSALLEDLGFKISHRHVGSWASSETNSSLPLGTLIVDKASNQAFVYLGQEGERDCWHDGVQIVSEMSVGHGELLIFEADPMHEPLHVPQSGWLTRLLYTARSEISGALLVSLFVNLIALVISLFTMYVYNAIIPSGAIDSLSALTIGACLAILGAWVLRLLRVKLISDLTSWAGVRISDIAIRKTFSMSADVSARLGVENNLIRLRSIESVRQWFGGGGAINIDYPFVLIFLFVIALLGGVIVLVPIIGLLLFAIASWPLSRILHLRSKEVGAVSRQMGEVLSVLSKRLRAIRGVRGSSLWNRYLVDLVSKSVAANRDYALASGMVQAIGQALSMLIVLGTMAVGIALVLNESMTTGGLIATMMLIWRITTPAQQMLSTQVRIKNLSDSTKQLDRLLSSPSEVSDPKMISPVAQISASVEIDRLYYRHSADREPAIANVSFSLVSGQFLALVGPNGAGKSTLLELILGLKVPQNGRVLVGGRDIRQFDPADYRAWLGYLPQRVPGLPVTIREALNFRGNYRSDGELTSLLTRVAGQNWYQLFGEQTPEAALSINISPWREDRDAVRGRFVVRLAIALLNEPKLILLDDPLDDRDPALDAYFLSLVNELHGKCTLIIATHRPDLIQMADQIAVLNEGALVHFGPVTVPST